MRDEIHVRSLDSKKTCEDFRASHSVAEEAGRLHYDIMRDSSEASHQIEKITMIL